MSRRDDRPWAHPLTVTVTDIGADWPHTCGPRQLRGAVIHQLAQVLTGPRELEAWTNRDGVTGDVLHAEPRVLYRVHREGPSVVCIGPEARELASTLAYHLTQLALPNGQDVPVRRVRTQVHDGTVQLLARGWARYRLRSPYWPSAGVARRRPRDRRLAAAWASQALASSITAWLDAWGAPPPPHRPVHVWCRDVRPRRLAWERPARGVREERMGFDCEILANALLPPGVGIGGKVSEGMGELELLEVTTC